MKTAPLPTLPPKVHLGEFGYTESMLVQFADRVRTLALLQASNECMRRMSRNIAEAKANDHVREDAEALACAKAIHALIDPDELRNTIRDEQKDLFADRKEAC